MAEISKISVQLLHSIFCDNHLTCLFRESEETTKHYLSLITNWWFENSKLLQFDEINCKFLFVLFYQFHYCFFFLLVKFLKKLQNSHILPKNIAAEINFKNLAVDLSEWQKSTNDVVRQIKYPSNVDQANHNANKLNLIEDASNNDKFFETLEGFAFNFQ